MTEDQLFRWILIAGFVLTMPVALYHRLLAHTGERLDRRQEGWFILIALRPLAAVGVAMAIILVFSQPRWMAWSLVPLPAWVRWIGVGLGVLGSVLLIWTMHTLGRNITDTVVTRKEHSLVVRGPYRWVRHPFYLAFLLGVTAISVVLANWLVWLFGITAFVLLVIRTRKEEENLLARFGDNYRRYREQTGAFFPRLYK
jgi:protein-S-isoprenylcysteine O-methyltransferase Ste14